MFYQELHHGDQVLLIEAENFYFYLHDIAGLAMKQPTTKSVSDLVVLVFTIPWFALGRNSNNESLEKLEDVIRMHGRKARHSNVWSWAVLT